MEQLKFILNNIVNLPLFPLLYYQGKKIRANVPELPEAQKPTGTSGDGSPSLRLLGLGESTIAGIGVDFHSKGFTGHLARLLAEQTKRQIDWQVVARSGYTAKKVRERLVPKLSTAPLDIIVIGLGGNDTFKLSSPRHWQQEISALITELQARFPAVKIVFANVPPIRSFPAFTPLAKFVLGRQIDLLHQVLVKLVKEHSQVWYVSERIRLSYWLEHFKEEAYTPHDFFSDGVHPSELTYRTWAAEVANFIMAKNILLQHTT